ncbi:unnamed protein product [Mytilus coruscus]|uniref:Uncharacterized protein n=1 Tax=Mytilus coruscus TaxID=42192 RepID=A0A6J8E7Z6_MYTCO|nr:unnamed protein product [Mytilus coruscus]
MYEKHNPRPQKRRLGLKSLRAAIIREVCVQVAGGSKAQIVKNDTFYWPLRFYRNEKGNERKTLSVDDTEQESRHFIKKVEETKLPIDRPVHYIPHHSVTNKSSTTPKRIVYDCSCKDGRGYHSLNECLESHPPVMNDITGILIRFRAKKYATSAD